MGGRMRVRTTAKRMQGRGETLSWRRLHNMRVES